MTILTVYTRNAKSRLKNFNDHETNTKLAGLNYCAFHATVNGEVLGGIMACRAKPRSAHLRGGKKIWLRDRKRL
jgi:hypothetical protein